jgi:hypothetical protein
LPAAKNRAHTGVPKCGTTRPGTGAGTAEMSPAWLALLALREVLFPGLKMQTIFRFVIYTHRQKCVILVSLCVALRLESALPAPAAVFCG